MLSRQKVTKQNVIQAKSYWAKCYLGKKSLGEMFSRQKVTWAKCYLGKKLLGEMLSRQKITKRNVIQAIVTNRKDHRFLMFNILSNKSFYLIVLFLIKQSEAYIVQFESDHIGY